ncbi:MAG: class I SAM-dependent methyltransferase [Myxococcales bacterium]|nr:class I SAM-dependent methyltransferase [Myxococcota bacterium]MDW8282610.1 class I SAM-dependent methyltransferase [Myxococcales bacterium]
MCTLDEVQRTARQRGWLAAAEVLSRAQRGARTLPSAERRFFADALHQMVRGLRRLRYLSGLADPGASQLYLCWLLDTWLGDPQGPPAALRAQAEAAGLRVAEVAQRRAAVEPPIPIDRLGTALSYPDWLVRLLSAEHGPEVTEAILAAQNRRAPLTVRVNLLRGPREALQARLAEEGVVSRPGALAAGALVLDTRINVYGLAAFRQGWMELQDEGSQLIAELVAPPPGGLVVDACAGAGGKTLALGSLMGNRGRILSLDIDPRKLQELRRRARRAGLTNVQARCVPPAGPPVDLLRRGADRVLVDAPCSGLGVLRRNPEARWRLSPSDPVELAARQRAILAAYAPLVAPGGRLIYATCTILREENDAVVEDFLRHHPEFRMVPIKEILGGERAARLGDGERMRLLPLEEDGPDGFFAAVLRRT